MCTYQTERLDLKASAKISRGWTSMKEASVYFDHPVHFLAGHALMIDLLNPEAGPTARCAIELDPSSARALAKAILSTLDNVPSELLSESAP